MITQSWSAKLFSIAALLVIILGGFLLLTFKVSAQTTLNVQFVDHIDANLPEQDVFVESADDPKKVVRVEGEEAKDPENLKKQTFAAANMIEHDPFKLGPNPLGPYAKGKPLGFTLEQWLDANGSGSYSVDEDRATLDINFENLVPNGVYTVWCSRLTFPPNPVVVDRPCGAEDGSENSFTADAEGNGVFILEVTPLEKSTQQTASVIALAYHSDGKTYGISPGEFGLNSHVQIFYLLPPAQAAESPTPQATPPQTVGGFTNQTWLLIGGGVILIILGWLWFSKKSSGSTPTPEA